MKNEVQTIIGKSLESKTLTDSIDGNHLTIIKQIGQGQFGSIYEARGVKFAEALVIKVSEDENTLKNEIKSLLRINKNKYFISKDEKFIPKVYSYGSFFHRKSELESPKLDKELFYYVMPKYGTKDMDQYAEKMSFKFTDSEILGFAVKILESLKMVHKAGYVYNDLKLDNIVVDIKKRGQSLDHAKIHLVDFGFASKYYTSVQTPEGIKHAHVPQLDLDQFSGNMINASIDKLNFLQSGRKDDLIALCYVLCYLFNKGSLPYVTDKNMETNYKKYNET